MTDIQQPFEIHAHPVAAACLGSAGQRHEGTVSPRL